MSLEDHPVAWTFHRNTSRWIHNAATSEGTDDAPEPGSESPGLPFTRLPVPRPVEQSLAALTTARCSCRDFSGAGMGLDQLGDILHQGYGVWGDDHWGTAEFLERPVPSGGGMYPLELYVIARDVEGLEPGIYHHVPLLGGLEQVREITIPESLLKYLFMGQYPVIRSAAIIVIAARVSRSMKKYGDRGYRYILFEAGHVAQNINLATTAVGLQSLNLGGFFDDELAQLLKRDHGEELTLYAVALGEGVRNRGTGCGSPKTRQRSARGDAGTPGAGEVLCD